MAEDIALQCGEDPEIQDPVDADGRCYSDADPGL